ncbi:MAG: serine hydrolase, partial [Bacteroidales bacterium]|nr:serine hydrolase [Bacteroidales bacterium]
MACLAVCVLMQACFKEEALKLPFTTYEPAVMADGWAVATPEAAGMDGAALTRVYRDFHERSDLWQVRSLLVFRHGRLVAESYTKDTADRTRPTAVWSCTKQVMALLTGLALERGLMADTADNIGRYLPEAAAHPDKAAIRILDLLTMRSGIGFENGGLHGGSNQLLKQVPDNSLDFVLGLPLRH